ncbi:MAG: cell division protein ZapE [Gammaproteobacteria bacterium]|nr:cell division protein ZapE [Gammaproteobacteria bacterium]
MTPKSLYLERIKEKTYVADPAQARAIENLDKLHRLLSKKSLAKNTFRFSFKQFLGIRQPAIQGLYLWGGVGRGKTWLMDLFYETLPHPDKIRLHFHHFMQAIHDQLSLLKGHKNPLILVARNFARKSSVLCLDEFHVEDITDAMLLYGLLDALFKEGVILVATSNLPPDELYKNGLQRERFLPAIELITKHTQTINIDGGTDHRLRLLEKAETWYITVDETSTQVLEARFDQLAPCCGQKNERLEINYRYIETVIRAEDVVWFSFDALCDGPRAAADYIEIARLFHTVFISDIPELNEASDDKAKRFVDLIDEFYDRNVKLIISAETLPQNLYSGHQLQFEFQRTISRLEEMRSHDYMARAHKP